MGMSQSETSAYFFSSVDTNLTHVSFGLSKKLLIMAQIVLRSALKTPKYVIKSVHVNTNIILQAS